MLLRPPIGLNTSLYGMIRTVSSSEHSSSQLIMPLIWYLTSFFSQLLCCMIFFAKNGTGECDMDWNLLANYPIDFVAFTNKLEMWQDDINWLAASISWPCLTTWFLWQSGDVSFLFILMHPFVSLILFICFAREKWLGKSIFALDLAKLSISFAALCTLDLTG